MLSSFQWRTFVAWLSTSVANAPSRLAGGGPWYVGDAPLGPLASITISALMVPIDRGPGGTAVGTLGVWTGTFGNGASAGNPCAEWTSSAVNLSANIGSALASDIGWTEAAVRGCSSSYHLYCFEM